MNTVYFIILHHKLYQFRWLFDAIYSDNDLFCIHVDHKSGSEFQEEVRRYAGQRPNVYFLPSRTVVWGGWSVVAVELDAIKLMLSVDPDWKYFVNLSGQDYPLKPLALINEKLYSEWPRNFIRAWSYDKVRELEPYDPHLPRILAFEAFGKLIKTKYSLPFPRSMDIKFKGSNWHMLTREFCQWMLTSPVAKRVARYVRYTFIPDEIFFQAAIMNSPFKDSRIENHRYVIWPGPKVLGNEDYRNIADSECLFGRKFDERHDRLILSRLAVDCGFSQPPPDDRIPAAEPNPLSNLKNFEMTKGA